MPKEYARTLRLNVQLQRELAVLIRDELTDPRVVPVTVTHAKVAPDMRNATVYVNVLGDDICLEAAVAALGHASARLRRLLGARLHTRVVPTLHFSADVAQRDGDRVVDLIRGAIASDRRAHEAETEGNPVDDGE